MKAPKGNATFNKINRAGNCEMRMIHIKEEKFTLKKKKRKINQLNLKFLCYTAIGQPRR